MAARYWVGGTGTWDNTAGSKWALTSGGTGGEAVPTSADDVFFDANSGANTVTIGITAPTQTLTMTGFTGTLAFGTNKIQIAYAGAVTTVFTGNATMSVTGTPLIELTGTGNSTKNITTGAVTEANSISFHMSAGTVQTITNFTNGSIVRDLNFTGYSGTLGASTRAVYGNVILSSTMTTTTGLNTSWAATSGTQTITCNGTSFNGSHSFDGVGGTRQLVDAFSTSSTLTLTAGTFNANNQNVTATTFSSSNSNTRTLTMGSGTWTLSGTGTVWNCGTSTNLTLNANTSTIALSDTSTTAKTFAGGGKTYNNLSIGATGFTTGIADYIFTGANTFTQISSAKTVAYSITLPVSTTTTVTTWAAGGSSGNLLTLKSTLTGIATLAVTNTFTTNFTNVALVSLSASNIGTVTNGTVLTSSGTGNWTIGSKTAKGNILISGTSWTVPSDWNNSDNTIHIFGAGGGGSATITNVAAGSGGGGGGYSRLTNQAGTPGNSILYTIGAGGSGGNGGSTNIAGTGGTTSWNGTVNTISYIGVASAITTTSTGTVPVDISSISSSMQTGDLMIVGTTVGSATAATWTQPAGWTEVQDTNSRAISYATWDGSTTSFTFTCSVAAINTQVVITVFRNASFDVVGSQSGASATPAAPSITVTNSNSALVAIYNVLNGTASYTTPTGFTEVYDAGVGLSVNYKLGVSAGSSGTVASTASSGTNSRGTLVALSPTISYTASASGGAGGSASSVGPTSTAGTGGTGSGGNLNYTGGTGGVGGVFASANDSGAGGGGGGAGPLGNGGNGGAGFTTNAGGGSQGSGGGGGNGGGSAGGAGTSISGGSGGNNFSGTGGGSPGTNSSTTFGTNGGGGGGSSGNNDGAGSGGNGIDVLGVVGSGGGSGGNGTKTFTATAGLYGGGGGGSGDQGTGSNNGCAGAQGAIIILWSPPNNNFFLMF